MFRVRVKGRVRVRFRINLDEHGNGRTIRGEKRIH